MILAIDMGNTNTVIGGIDEERTYFIERVKMCIRDRREVWFVRGKY